MFASEDCGAGRAADGVSAVGSFEQHAFLGDAVDVRGGGDFIETCAVCGDRLQCMVVRENEDDVWSFGRNEGRERGEKDCGKLDVKVHNDL